MISAAVPENENERMAALLAMGIDDANKKKQFDKVIAILSKCFNVPIAYVSAIKSDTQEIHSSCGLNFKTSKRATSFCGHSILQAEILVVEDTLKDERFYDNPMVVGGPKIRFYAGFPLVTAPNLAIGALCIADHKPRKFTDEDALLLKSIGTLLIERLKLFQLGDYQEKIFESKKELERVNNKLKKNNQFYKQLFGQYISESLLQSILENESKTELGGEEKFATVLMTDLRGFTSLSEFYSPEVIVRVLNIYLDRMIDVIHKYDGYINEILGDGILVVFGVPNSCGNCADKAVKCARAMQSEMRTVNALLKESALPELAMGIGVNSGAVIAGNIGSKKRMKYGVVGDTVNIAARIEAMTLADQILISDVTYNKIKDSVKPIGQIRVKIKGIRNPIMIHDVSLNT